MIKFIAIFCIMTMPVLAQSQDKINLDMCGSSDFHFDEATKECIYCAHDLQYDRNLKCVGTLSVLGKCYGDHHYHAATKECMFCGKGYVFNESSRTCELGSTE